MPAGGRGEQAAPFVDPDVKNGAALFGDQIEVAIAIHIGDNESDDRVAGAERIRLRVIRQQQRRKRTERCEDQPARGASRCVDDAVAVQGSCDLDHLAIMQNPDSGEGVFTWEGDTN